MSTATACSEREAKVRTAAKKILPIALGLAAGVALWIFSGSVIKDWSSAVLHPAPLIYTEGVMAWASGEIDRGGSPYGRIFDIPSKYFCYGPIMPAVVAAVGEDGPSYVRVGRVLAGLSLIAAAILCGLLCRILGGGWMGAGASSCFFFAAVFSSHHAWSFRVDTAVVALGLASVVLSLLYSKRGKWYLLAGVFLVGVFAGGTKFTSCFWAGWTVLLSGGISILAQDLRKRDKSRIWKNFGGPVVYGVGWLLGTVATEVVFPGALGDQVWNQAGSGLNPWGYTRNTLITVAGVAAMPFIFAAGAAILTGQFRIMLVACAAGLLSAAMLIKFGSDINYFFDFFALLSVAAGAGAGSLFRPWGGILVSSGAALFLASSSVSVPDNMPHRLNEKDFSREIVASRETSYLFRGAPNLCEDPFFPVYHGGEVLVSDPFQASLDSRFQTAARQVARESGRLVVGDRLGRSLGASLWNRFIGAKWLHSAGLPGAGVYLPSAEVRDLHQQFPELKFQVTPSEIRFFAANGENINWQGVAEVARRMTPGRKLRFFSETKHPLDYFVLSGGAGAGGWR